MRRAKLNRGFWGIGLGILTALCCAPVGWAQEVSVAPAPKLVEPQLCLEGLDPVELIAGSRREGDPNIAADRGRFRYRFVSAENKGKFESDPNRYAVRLGGGCGRMGPLAGMGDPSRFLVHDGGIYLFASDSCLGNFRNTPALHIDGDDEVPEVGSAAEQERAKELLDRVILGLGGPQAVDAVQGISWVRVTPYTENGVAREQVTTLRARRGNCYEIQDAWHGGMSVDVACGDRAYRGGSEGYWPMDGMVRREFLKGMRRQPLLLVLALSDSESAVAAGGSEQLNDKDLDRLIVHVGGATIQLGVERGTNRVVVTRHRGRAPGAIGKVERWYSDFREVGGLVLPHSWTARYGDPAPGQPVRFTRIEVNPQFGPEAFALPEE